MRNPWKTLSSRIAYENPWLRVREDRLERLNNGRPGLYGVIEIRPSIGVVALDAADQIVLVGQWRYPHAKYTWEIPRGGSHEGETDMQAVAARELREETGVLAGHWQSLGAMDMCNGVTTDTQHVYLATGLEIVETQFDPEEEIEVRWLPFAEAVNWALTGYITECCSVGAILKVELLRRRTSGCGHP